MATNIAMLFLLNTARTAFLSHIIFSFIPLILAKIPFVLFKYFSNCMKLTTIAGFNANRPFPDANP